LVAQPDDWSGRKPITPLADAALNRRDCDPNGGIRREPELQNEEVVIRAPLAENEFDPAQDEGDTDALQASGLSRSMQRIARSVSLDRDDKMGL
jgi:type IV secretion system protein VirD4